MEVPTLTLDAVVLNGLTADDAATMVATDDEPTQWAWCRSNPLAIDQALREVENAQRGWADDSYYSFAIRRLGDASYLGRVELKPKADRKHGSVTLSVIRAVRRQGVGTDATRIAIDYAFETLGWWLLIADIRPGNPSADLALKLGFRRSGDLVPVPGCDFKVQQYLLTKNPDVYVR